MGAVTSKENYNDIVWEHCQIDERIRNIGNQTTSWVREEICRMTLVWFRGTREIMWKIQMLDIQFSCIYLIGRIIGQL